MKKYYVVLLTVASLWLGNLAASPAKVNYHLLKKIPLGAAPGGGEYFDYITFDPSTRRLYLTHGTEVKVVDVDSGDVVGTIPGLIKCHGVALVKELGKGFITDDIRGAVIFDLESLKVTGEVKTSGGSDSIIYDPASKHIFTFNGHKNGDATVIDPENGTVVGTLPLGGTPEFPVTDGRGIIYDNNQDTNEVVLINSRALTIKARWPVAPAGAPTSLAMDYQHRRLFSSGRNPQQLVVIDANDGKIIQSFPITAGVDANAYDPETRLLFSSTREAIHIFHEDSPNKFSVVDTVKTEYGAKTMALDPKTHNLYLTTADFGPAPAPTAERPHPNPVPTPGTFRLLIYGR
jgi:hypothetical protein